MVFSLLSIRITKLSFIHCYIYACSSQLRDHKRSFVDGEKLNEDNREILLATSLYVSKCSHQKIW